MKLSQSPIENCDPPPTTTMRGLFMLRCPFSCWLDAWLEATERIVARRIEEVDAAGPHPELDPLADPRRDAALTADHELCVVAAYADERLAAHRFHELRPALERAVQVPFVRPEAGVFRPDSDDNLGGHVERRRDREREGSPAQFD